MLRDAERLDKMTKFVTTHAERQNTTVISAPDGMKALQQLDAAALPDLVIMDADTQGRMSASDVLTTLRGEHTPELNVVVVCAAGGSSRMLRSTQARKRIGINRCCS